MRRALELARGGLGLASPNPMVGAVLVAGGTVVGEGWHEGPGMPHAEVNAIRAAGDRAHGATLYVTLEPCSHVGRTPPCATAVVDAGIARVVAGTTDPNPVVDGSGFRFLEASGVEVIVGVLEEEAAGLIAGFAKHVRTGLPFVTLKMAASLDGRTAAPDGSARWITGAEARRDVHGLRAASDAVVVGSATALLDDPSLTVRLDGYRGRQPLRVLIDGTGKVSPTGAIFDEAAPTLVATTASAPEELRNGWARAGAKVWMFESKPGQKGLVPTRELVEALGREGIQTALIEGGSTLAWGAVAEGAVDRLVIYLAPKLVGGRDAPGILGGPGVRSITDALPVSIRSVERIGPDLKVVADVHRDR